MSEPTSPARVLVTGGAGFVGSATVRLLVERGYDVTVYDDLSTGHLAAVPTSDRCRFVREDICNAVALCDVLRDEKIDAVIHFAALALVGESLRYPADYYDVNVGGSLNVLDACRFAKVKRFVFSSSCATYGVPPPLPIPESAPQVPINPYGNTKLAVERALRDYHAAYGLDYMTLRYFNAAGPGEDHDPETHLIPRVIGAATGKYPSVTIHGGDHGTPDGTCVRDYVHVDDLATAHLAALTTAPTVFLPKNDREFNVGTGTGTSVLDVIGEVGAVLGRSVPIEIGPKRPGDPPYLVADTEKIRRVLGWEPKYNFHEIAKSAWEWHHEHPRGYDNGPTGDGGAGG